MSSHKSASYEKLAQFAGYDGAPLPPSHEKLVQAAGLNKQFGQASPVATPSCDRSNPSRAADSPPQRIVTPGERRKQVRGPEVEDDPSKKTFKFGELYFEETGQLVPYLIIPDTPQGREPETIVAHISRCATQAPQALSDCR